MKNMIFLAVFAVTYSWPNSSFKQRIIIVEAESFAGQEKSEVRQWTIEEDSAASGGAYIHIVPDTRVTDKDSLVNGVNFSNLPGKMAVISYPVRISKPGRYYVWVRAFSSGAEDNSVHVGLNGTWPASGARMQWCEGKNAWKWGSKQRTQKNHCGEPYLIYLDVAKPGKHIVQFSMREDGFRMDQFLLSLDKAFDPEKSGPNAPLLPKRTKHLRY
ncbi:MAG: hypothetical protein KBG02_00185 [Haliscomenobacter sp.]|nr:hypothetical protein [Haliscomenobacter sp.]MBP9075247.1 hypothetical protein [Haliscomenobacter sp.]MBP9873104.1 hypothetical protein [Haliscomenobacter sp.]